MSELIAKDMPEPQANGLYILHCCADEVYIEKDATGYCDDDEHWYDTSAETLNWDQLRSDYDGYTIESLSDHDARIRREALMFSDEEREIIVDALVDEGFLVTPKAMRVALTEIAENRERES
jgi:hypothetical protein